MTAGSSEGANGTSIDGDSRGDGLPLYSRGYLRLSFVAFAFLAAVHEIEHWMWVSPPDAPFKRHFLPLRRHFRYRK